MNIKQILNLDPEKLSKMNKAELLDAVKKVRGKMKRDVAKIQKYDTYNPNIHLGDKDYDDTGTTLVSPAYRSLWKEKTVRDRFGNKYREYQIDYPKAGETQTRNELLHELSKGLLYYNHKTSTLKGTIQSRRELEDRLIGQKKYDVEIKIKDKQGNVVGTKTVENVSLNTLSIDIANPEKPKLVHDVHQYMEVAKSQNNQKVKDKIDTLWDIYNKAKDLSNVAGRLATHRLPSDQLQSDIFENVNLNGLVDLTDDQISELAFAVDEYSKDRYEYEMDEDHVFTTGYDDLGKYLDKVREGGYTKYKDDVDKYNKEQAEEKAKKAKKDSSGDSNVNDEKTRGIQVDRLGGKKHSDFSPRSFRRL